MLVHPLRISRILEWNTYVRDVHAGTEEKIDVRSRVAEGLSVSKKGGTGRGCQEKCVGVDSRRDPGTHRTWYHLDERAR